MADIRKAAFKEKFIKNLDFSDFKVAVSGVIVKILEEGFLLGDGSGEVYVNTSRMENQPINKEQENVKVFGRITPYESGIELQADIVRNLEGVDMDALKRIKEAFL